MSAVGWVEVMDSYIAHSVKIQITETVAVVGL